MRRMSRAELYNRMSPNDKRRCEAISDFLRLLQRRLAIPTQGAMAKELGMTEGTYKMRLHDPRRMTLTELWSVERVARRAGLTLPEVRNV